MEEYCMECLQVNNALERMVDRFAKKYYWEDFQREWIDWRDEDLHYNLQINDDFRNIDEVYTALWFDIPKKILFEYKEKSLESAYKKEPFMNLKNFYFMKKDGK